MRIGINGYFLREPWTGMGNHLAYLLAALDAREAGDERYSLLVPRFPDDAVSALARPGDAGPTVMTVSALNPLPRRFSM